MQEAKDLRKKLEETHKFKAKLEDEVATVRETVHRAAIKLSPHARQKSSGSSSSSSRSGGGEGGGASTSSVSQDLTGVMERLHQLETERKVCCGYIFYN